MKFFPFSIRIGILVALFFIGNTLAYAETYIVSDRVVERPTPERFTNENWFSIPHPRVRTFTMLRDGSSYGYTESGIRFVQYNVPNISNIRVQRFEIEDHYHYIIDGEIVETFEEFSMRLARAYQLRQG